MNNQVITQDGKKYDYRVFNNFGENPKNDRPANEYKLTVTRLPEMANEEREGIFNQYRSAPVNHYGLLLPSLNLLQTIFVSAFRNLHM